MADAFSAFANGGVREDSHLITKIVGPTGNVIAEHETKSTKITSKTVANEMTSMLLNVVETGTEEKLISKVFSLLENWFNPAAIQRDKRYKGPMDGRLYTKHCRSHLDWL